VREAVTVLMEGTPRGLDVEEVSAAIAQVPGVPGVHHLHVWSLGSDLTALGCHVVVEDQPVADPLPIHPAAHVTRPPALS